LNDEDEFTVNHYFLFTTAIKLDQAYRVVQASHASQAFGLLTADRDLPCSLIESMNEA
jgi:hypothetical protein